MEDRTYLVTGGSGFVGGHLCSAISAVNGHLRLLLRRPITGIDAKQYICDFKQDIIPEEVLVGVDTVFHLAGFTHDMRDTSVIEHLYRIINVDTTVHLAELAAKNGVKHFIYISSTKAGGSAMPGICVSEKDQCEPEGIYGKTKRIAEIKLLEIGKQSGMHVSIIRPSLVYGSGVKGNLRTMLNGIDRGWFPPIPDTHNRRSMIHVDDVVRAMLLVSNDRRANGEIFILTDGRDYSSREIYDAMCHAVGRKIPRWSLPDALFEVAAKFGDLLKGKVPFPFDSYRYQKLLGDECFSSDKILTLLDFKPNYSLFDALPDMVTALRSERK
ncbi:MAG: NAD-dependent epimerase/dehydratase family protein [Candidatus Pacearchaeota archaeon]|nr:NAD-dependent epimerase/dehydratase family protein [Candidatus Pacearchaeota archaeon]